MELDGGGDGGGSGGGGGGGEGGGGLSMEVEKKNMPEGEPKVKRRMKTPSQLEILEKTYAMETYPSEALRAELSVKLGLTDRQLQMWFCHRRLKDRKPPPEKRQKKSFSPSAAAGPSGGSADEMILDDADVAKESGSGLSLFGNMDLLQQQQRVVHKVGSAVPRISSELPSMRRFYEPPLAISEQRAIAFVEAQLGEPLREDGPILGMEFDPLPPGAFGAPIGERIVGISRINMNLAYLGGNTNFIYEFCQQKPSGQTYDVKLYESPESKQIKNLTLLETSIKKDFLSANYETTCEILSSRKIIADSLSGPEEISVLPWIPQTTSAVALQLMELDSSIYYTVHEKESCQKDNQAGYFAKGPLRCYSLDRAINNVSQAGYLQQDNWVDLVSGRTNLRRGRGRPRGWKGRPRGRGGRNKGRRSIRRKQKPSKGSGKNVVEKSGMKKSNFGDTPGPQQEEWNLEETPMEVPGGENVSSSGRSEFEDGNSQASADEYDDVSVDDISGVRNGKSRYFTAVDDYKLCGEDGHHDGDDVDENDEYEGDDGDNEQRDFYVDGYFNSDFHEEGNQPTGVEHVRDVLDRGLASSSSSDYIY
ncbi:UNVERIFIED_CONTAM: Homeobox-DDT domain protein RLT2 [Sesamum angustifolium]|uniref:Homeobox-DDT domain protein RLT2 n=1 Tax=Sesamum angustifolium TaxID=2727405 RepID=A0AAW2KX52_9LAMI